MNLGAPKGPGSKRNSQVVLGAPPTPEMGGNVTLSIYTFLSIEGLPGVYKVLILCSPCCVGMSPEAGDISVGNMFTDLRTRVQFLEATLK